MCMCLCGCMCTPVWRLRGPRWFSLPHSLPNSLTLDCSLSIFFFSDIYVMPVCVCVVCAYMHVEARGGLQVSNILLCYPPPIPLRQSLSLNLELDWQPTGPQHWGYRCVQSCPAFHVNSRDLNLGPHACLANICACRAIPLPPPPQASETGFLTEPGAHQFG